ncbi:MAG: hypothetical protein AAB519_00245 [Patescibacteria group bacterium]
MFDRFRFGRASQVNTPDDVSSVLPVAPNGEEALPEASVIRFFGEGKEKKDSMDTPEEIVDQTPEGAVAEDFSKKALESAPEEEPISPKADQEWKAKEGEAVASITLVQNNMVYYRVVEPGKKDTVRNATLNYFLSQYNPSKKEEGSAEEDVEVASIVETQAEEAISVPVEEQGAVDTEEGGLEAWKKSKARKEDAEPAEAVLLEGEAKLVSEDVTPVVSEESGDQEVFSKRRRKGRRDAGPKEDLSASEDASPESFVEATVDESVQSRGEEILDAEFEDIRSDSREVVPAPLATRENLVAEVADARKKFAEADLAHNKAWKDIARTIPGLKNSKSLIESSDLTHFRTEYQGKLQELRSAEIERLKSEGFSGKKLEHEIEKVVRYFQCDEAVALYEARTEVRKENQNWGGKALEAFGNIGKAYNKLSWKQKLVITGACLAGTAALTLTAGVAGGAVAGGALLARKFVVAAGTTVTAETLMKMTGEKLRDKDDTKKIGKKVEKLGVTEMDGVNFERLSQILDSDIAHLDKKLQKKKWAGILQKSSSLAIGFGATFGMSALLSHPAEAATPTETAPVSETMKVEALPQALTDSQQAVDVQAGHEYVEASPEAQAEIRQTTGLTDEQLRGLATQQEATDAPLSPSAETSTASAPEAISEAQTIEGIRGEYTTTASDARRGLWGVLDSRLPEDMPKAERVKVISSLENAIAAKLHDMSPEQLRAVGFSSGDVNIIHPGDTLKLGELLSADDTKTILEGKIILPIEAEVPSEIPTEAPTPDTSVPEAEGSVSSDASLVESPKEAVTVPTEAAVTPAAEVVAENIEAKPEGTFKDQLRAFFQEHPGKDKLYLRNLAVFRGQLFETPEVGTLSGYDQSLVQEAMNHTEVGQVLSDHAMLEGNKSYLYDKVANPFHVSQMENLDRLVVAAGREFGAAGRPGPTETVSEYTKRVMFLLFQKNIDNPSFTFKF